VLNALSGKYYNASALVDVDPKPPVLWIRGADDQIVGDLAMFDVAALGSVGAIPGHPGKEICPPQPMIGQTRSVLDRYAESGGRYQEVVLDDCGHTPCIEQPSEFNAAFHRHLAA
jgi:pimeloyl-ACP methyl ester carboxylesterase